FTYTFQVTGNEGNLGSNAPPDDSAANAHLLGDLSQAGLVQVAGAIGTDPTDPTPFNPSGVDLYHFGISGPGRYAFTAEVFAGRIGSPLDSMVNLFQRVSPDNQPLQLHLVAANDDTQNAEVATNYMLPLFTDSVVYAGLTQGDYYLAVTSSGNTFDPITSQSGQGGNSTGNYVLNVRALSDNVPPQVLATTLPEGATLAAPPTQLTVQFSEPVNLQPLIYQAYQQTSQYTLSMIYVQGGDGHKYFPRMTRYDPATGQASFLMLDALANGSYQ